jgi:septum formation protein
VSWPGEAGGEHEQRTPNAAPHAAVLPRTSRPDNLTARQPAATIRRVRLVLASASPRRHELLGWLGIDFVVDAADVDERPRPGESAERLVRRLAAAKASAGAARWRTAWVLAADTVVEIDGDILGKPVDPADAAAMLARLGGREHRVVTGFVLIEPGGAVRADESVVSRVCFRALRRAVIAAYVESGEPFDKAGGYAIQGRGAALVSSIEGSFTNVIGLPLVEVERALAEAGLLAG